MLELEFAVVDRRHADLQVGEGGTASEHEERSKASDWAQHDVTVRRCDRARAG